ncbi:unnamed protein product [Diamesa hyperborea]
MFSDNSDDEYGFSISKKKENKSIAKEILLDLDHKIKIIPNCGFEAGLFKNNFDITLDEHSQEWFNKIHEYWKQYKKCPILAHTLQSFYTTSSNPFVHALKFFANCSDYPNPKSNSFSYTILEELLKYKKTLVSLGGRIEDYVDDNIKMVSFNFVKKCGQVTCFKLVVTIFDLVKSKHLFVGPIKELMASKYYKEAGQISCDLQLFNEFTLDDFILPLILEDKLVIVEEYLDSAKNLIVPTIRLLDSFLDRNSSVSAMCSPYVTKYNLTDVKYDKLQKKPISKLITRWFKKYNIEENIAPNTNKQKAYGALHFLLQKKFKENSLNQASYEEMIRDTIAPDNKELQYELVMACLGYNDITDAVNWAKYYNVPLDDVPSIVREYIENDGKATETRVNASSSEWDDDWGEYSNTSNIPKEQETVHTLNLDESQLILVDNLTKYQEMIKDLSSSQIISFDTEWKPKLGLSGNNVSLIQFAKRDIVYLVDVIKLMEQIPEHEWSKLGRMIFNNDDILKLGFAHATDLTMLDKFAALNIQSALSQQSASYLDLQELWTRCNEIHMKFPYRDDGCSGKSLSTLVYACLGKKLDKSNQFSNWQQRPLRKEQLLYASLDAFCLFEIYDVIAGQITNMDIDFNEFINNILTENKRDLMSLRKKDHRHNKGSRRPVK